MCNDSFRSCAHARHIVGSTQTRVRCSLLRGRRGRKKNTPVQKYPQAPDCWRGLPDFPGPTTPEDQGPPGTTPVHLRAAVRAQRLQWPRSPRTQPAAPCGHLAAQKQPRRAPLLPGSPVARPPRPPRGARLGPRGVPKPRPSSPAQLREGLEIELLDFLLAQPVANSLPFQEGLHLLPPRPPGSLGPEEIAHRPSVWGRRAPRTCGHLHLFFA